MTHYNLNRIILGVAAMYVVVIIAAIAFGPASPDDQTEAVEFTPGFADADTTPTPFTGVGGSPEDETAITGVIVDADTEEPLAGVSVSAVGVDSDDVITTTGADGRFEIKGVPDPASVSFSLSGYASSDAELGPNDDHTIALGRPMISGRVISADGSPIRGATVASDDVFTRSVESGSFRLDGVSDDTDIIVKAAGHATQVVARDEFDTGFVLEPTEVRAAYAPASLVADSQAFNTFLEMIEQSELNAVVVDLKDHLGRVQYHSSVEMAQEIGAVSPKFDIEPLLSELDERGITAIGRISVFEDPALAEARPDLAIQDSWSGDLWRTWQGRAWANPYETDVWDYNIAIIQEATRYGFDEIQLASVQFPDSGLINRADYGQTNTRSRRQQAIADFLDQAYAVAAPTESLLTAEIFAMSLWDETNPDTGQDLTSMAERVDYIHPLLFPSHFASGSLGYDDPGSVPAAMVSRSIESGQDLLPRHLHARIRPWLQAFSYGSAMPFDAEAIRAQIEAAEEFGSGSWMLWNPDGSYHSEALDQVE